MTPKLIKVTAWGNIIYAAATGVDFTSNLSRTYEEHGVPLEVWLEVSDEPTEDSEALHRLESRCSNYMRYRAPGITGVYSLDFCEEGLTNFFGSVPEVIYWRIPHETN